MGIQQENTNEQIAEQLKTVKEQLADLGVESAELSLSSVGKPIIKSFTISNLAVKSVANADPGNVQQVAASQLEIINSYYQSVLYQAKESFQWALVAAGSGLIFFLVAIGFLVHEKSEKISNTSLISGALVEVIAGINFYLYSRASDQLSRFHTRFLANSLCENLEGEIKHKTRAELVKLIANHQMGLSEEKNSTAKEI